MVDMSSQSIGGAAVVEKQTERLRKLSPRYKVLLHNVPVNTMDYVVNVLRQVVLLMLDFQLQSFLGLLCLDQVQAKTLLVR